MIAHEISIRNIVLGSVKSKDYCDNSVQTGKYNVFTFLPLALYEQFQKVANLYFLFISCLMLIGTYTMLFDSPLTPWSTLIILGLVIVISLTRTGYEDYQRHYADSLTNTRTISVFNSKNDHNFTYKTVQWREIQVGDIVRLEKNQEIPADMLLISSSEEEGLAFVETSNIDGETNLKLKTSVRLDKIPPNAFNNLETFKRVEIVVKCEQPNSDIHNFNGSVYANGREEGVDASSLLLRGSSLRNTKHAIGIVVYTGKETKLVMNSRKPPSKVSYIERIMNQIIVVILWCQIGLAAISAILYYVWLYYHIGYMPYLCYDTSLYTNTLLSSACDNSNNYSSFGYFFSFFILYSNFIPISLYVTVEICNYFQAFFIDCDREMYDEVSDTPALARTSNMNSDLGMVEYIFSDKTGTLTDNVMNFKRCSVAGVVYGDSPIDEGSLDSESESGKVIRENLKVIRGRPVEELADRCSRELGGRSGASNAAACLVHADFLLVLALCHTVIIDTESSSSGSGSSSNNNTQQQQLVSESPDEEALVKAAQTLGLTFAGRSPGRVNLLQQQAGNNGTAAATVSVSYELLATIPFDSTRKRMSVVVKRPDGSIVVYCKGADNIIFERASHFVDSNGSVVSSAQAAGFKDTLVMHLDCFASDGLRTLVIAKKELSSEVYGEFSKIWGKAEKSVNQRQAFMQQAAELVESQLTVLGATAIEDKLQVGVASTISDLRAAGIKLWVLTGDKMETAINIGYSSRLLMPNMILIKLAYKGEDTMAVRRKLGTLLHHFQTLAEEHSDFFKKWINSKKKFFQDINTGYDGTGSNSAAASSGGGGGSASGGGGSASGGMSGTRSSNGDDEDEDREPFLFDPIAEGSPLLEKTNKAPGIGQITCDHLGLVVDGETLIRIFSDSVAEHLFLALSMICRSVIACRVSPEQKRLIVRLVKRGVQPAPVTLSIGDGANDVAMIQEAQIGVGISGKEGRQAVNNSDFAIAQFRFLRRLLLIHGRLDYRRICKVVEYSFYKNIVSTIVVFCFTFFSAYSGQSLFEDSIHAVYNVVLAWPVIGFGIFDRDISEKTLLKHNFLYLSGRKRLDLNISTMMYAMLQALLDGVIIFFVPYYVYRQPNDIWNGPDAEGRTAGLWVFGTTVYCCLMGAMFVKIYTTTCTWTWLSHLFFWGSIVLFLLFLIWYQYWIDWSYNYYGTTFEMFSSSTFWWLLWLVPTASYLVNSCISMIQKEFFPTIVDIGTEYDQGAASLPLLPSWLWPQGDDSSDPLMVKALLPAEFDELMQTILTFGTNKYIMDWDNIKQYFSSFMTQEQANLGLLNTSTTNRAESTFNFDHVASNYNSSAIDSHVVHISSALLFPIQYVARLTGSAASSSNNASSSGAGAGGGVASEERDTLREDLKDLI